MKNDIVWIGVAVVVVGLAIAGGLLFLRSHDSAASRAAPQVALASVGPAAVPSVDGQGATPEAAGPGNPETTSPVDVSPVAFASSPAAPQTPAAPSVQPSAAASSAPAGLVAIGTLIKNGAEYEGRTVTVKGKVLTQCLAGCEWSVDDGTGVLSVQLEGEALDQVLARGSVGKKIEVTGIFHFTPRPQIAIEKVGAWRLF